MIPPPPSDEFSKWAEATIDISPRLNEHKNWINTNASIARNAIQSHDFIQKLSAYLSSNRYTDANSANKIISSEFEIFVKSFDSILSKIYRHNVLQNTAFPSPPDIGWINSKNMFDRLNDLVRGTLICRFFQEPRKISEDIRNIAEDLGLRSIIKPHARDTGYYAYHIYIYFPIDLLDRDYKDFRSEISLEIQITTEMQYILYDLTHAFYEDERHKPAEDGVEWKWLNTSPRFSATYISHSLHFLEGLIQRLYDESKPQLGPSSGAPAGSTASDER